MAESIAALNETSRWHARDVRYWSGRWDQLASLVPRFETSEFSAADDGPPNPYLRSVVRLPMTPAERPIPVGVVSHSYALAQHHCVAAKCFEGIRNAGIEPPGLKCELGLTELGEWMDLRIYFPEGYRCLVQRDGALDLRLECFNSVDGSSCLVIFLGWFRFVCSNGLVIGKTQARLREIHDVGLDLHGIPSIVADGLELVEEDRARLTRWQRTDARQLDLATWVDKSVTQAWGKNAACRVFHICSSGYDVELTQPFASGEATEKPAKPTQRVPGLPEMAENLYDVSQALSWVATLRNQAEERVKWQANVPELVEAFAKG